MIPSNPIYEDYLDWLSGMVDMNSPLYSDLMQQLLDTPFEVVLERDNNRVSDGKALRYEFGDAFMVGEDYILEYLDSCPVSVLEVMVALAIRMERMMYDFKIGDRTGFWFREMLKSLEILNNDGDLIGGKRHVSHVLNRFLTRNYDESGRGGLFRVRQPKNDLRMTEIWFQAMWYLSEYENYW